MAQVGNILSIPRALRIFQRKLVPATCGVFDAVGDCVYAVDESAGAYTVAKADPKDYAKLPAFGIIKDKSASTVCTVQLFGETGDMFAGLTPGKPVFLSETGELSHTLPVPDIGGYAFVQRMGVAVSTVSVLLQPEFNMVKRRR